MAISDPQTRSGDDSWHVLYRKDTDVTLSGATEYGSKQAAAEAANDMEERESVEEAWAEEVRRRRISRRW